MRFLKSISNVDLFSHASLFIFTNGVNNSDQDFMILGPVNTVSASFPSVFVPMLNITTLKINTCLEQIIIA